MDDETRKELLGEVLMGELKAIREYVEDIPDIKRQLHNLSAETHEINERLTVLETVVRSHETDIKQLKYKATR